MAKRRIFPCITSFFRRFHQNIPKVGDCSAVYNYSTLPLACQAFFSIFSIIFVRFVLSCRFFHTCLRAQQIFSTFFAKPLAFFEKACYNITVCEFIRTRNLSVVCGNVINFSLLKKREVFDLANIKSAKKRVKVIAVKTMRNKAVKTQLKTEMKKYEAALATGDMAAAQAAYKSAVKKLDQAAAHGIIHKNAVAHKKSQFTKKLNALG